MATDRQDKFQDPFGGYNFVLEMGGITTAGFKECSGLDSTTANTKYREGSDATLAQRELPGLTSFSNISLKKGITSERALWDWRERVMGGRADRRNITVTLRDAKGTPQISWDLRECWPSKWTGPTFDATSDATAIESLDLVHEGIKVSKWT